MSVKNFRLRLRSSPETFHHSRTAVKAWMGIAALVAVFAIGTSWSYVEAGLVEKLFVSFLLVGLVLLFFCQCYSYRILVDEQGITERKIGRVVHISWHEIDDVLTLQNVTVIKSSKKNTKISLFHPEPGNLIHQIGALDRHEELREIILSHSVSSLKQIWNEDRSERAYRYPRPLGWIYLLSISPLLVPVLALLVFGTGPIAGVAFPQLYLFLPFLFLSGYLAYRCGLFSWVKTVVLNENGLSTSNGAHVRISWDEILSVDDVPGSLGYGGIIIRSHGKVCIAIPKSIDRFCDLALQIKKRVPQKFTAQLYIPGAS